MSSSFPIRGQAPVWIVGLTLLGLGLGCMDSEAPRHPGQAVSSSHPAPETYRDLAVSCLVAGEAGESSDLSADPEFEGLVEAVAWLTHTYQESSFDSFLALRAGDLQGAQATHAQELVELQRLCRAVGVPEQEVPSDWIGALQAFWGEYYERPPVHRFLPERARVEAGSLPTTEEMLADWTRSFEEFCQRGGDPATWHRLMVPHQRSLSEIATALGELRWIDLDLPFDSTESTSERLIARLVWDGVGASWFLERAATVHEGEVVTERPRLVL